MAFGETVNSRDENQIFDREDEERALKLRPGYPGAVPDEVRPAPQEFARGSILRAILRMGLPSVIGFLAVNIYDLADMFWVAKLGAQYVAAIALFEGFYWVLISTNDVAGLGSIAIISRRYGEGMLARAASAIKETFILKWICALVSGSIGLIFLRPLMRLMGAQGEVVDLGVQYGRVHMFALGFYFCTYSVMTSLRSIDAPKKAMWLMIFGAILNMLLDPLLIFGLGPFPKLGIAGAAWASALSFAATFAVGLYVFFIGRAPVRLRWRGEVPVRLKTMGRMMRIGLPGGVNTVSFTLARAVITPLVAVFGTSVVASYGVGMRVMHLGILVIFGLSMGVSPLIGNLLGAGLKDRLWRTAHQSLLLTLAVMTAMALVIFGLAPRIVLAFFQSADLLAIGVELLRIWSISLPFIGVWIISESIFHGAGDNVPPMLVSILASWLVQIPLILVFTKILGFDQTSVWWAWVIHSLFGASVILFWLHRGQWVERKV